ncbi:MAG TPA: redox-sensing transcriptional repressor Rex [Elusimicrobiota bacterium]|nr:redox-sensing transcriptional repressor Rex [Elusimicrobiota bacterium]
MENIPELAVSRLLRYHHILMGMSQGDVVSSSDLSEKTGYTAAQIRRDLTYFGQFGTPGRGYTVDSLRNAIADVLGINRESNVLIMGVGRVGAALLHYESFEKHRFHVVAAVDVDPEKVGLEMGRFKVRSVEDLSDIVTEGDIRMAILCVPPAQAQTAVEQLVRAGIRAILNLTAMPVDVPDDVSVRPVNLAVELEWLAMAQSRRGGSRGEKAVPETGFNEKKKGGD